MFQLGRGEVWQGRFKERFGKCLIAQSPRQLDKYQLEHSISIKNHDPPQSVHRFHQPPSTSSIRYERSKSTRTPQDTAQQSSTLSKSNGEGMVKNSLRLQHQVNNTAQCPSSHKMDQ